MKPLFSDVHSMQFEANLLPSNVWQLTRFDLKKYRSCAHVSKNEHGRMDGWTRWCHIYSYNLFSAALFSILDHWYAHPLTAGFKKRKARMLSLVRTLKAPLGMQRRGKKWQWKKKINWIPLTFFQIYPYRSWQSVWHERVSICPSWIWINVPCSHKHDISASSRINDRVSLWISITTLFFWTLQSLSAEARQSR